MMAEGALLQQVKCSYLLEKLRDNLLEALHDLRIRWWRALAGNYKVADIPAGEVAGVRRYWR